MEFFSQLILIFLKKSAHISQTLEGFEGLSRFLSLPEILKNPQWVIQKFQFDKFSQITFPSFTKDDSKEITLSSFQEKSSLFPFSESQRFSEQILQEYFHFFVKSYTPLSSLSSRFQNQKLMFLKGQNLKHIEKIIDQK